MNEATTQAPNPTQDGAPQPEGIVTVKPKPLKVAIVGKAPSTIAMAPYDDPTWEIWTLSNNAMLGEAKRWDRHVEIHSLAIQREEKRKKYWEWLCSEPAGERPIYMQEVVPEIPAAVLFPKSKAVEVFGTYFNNTVSWMIALAMLKGVKELGIFGVDMACDGQGEISEYAHQRPSCEYMIGLATGRGIQVHVPNKSDLLKAARLYGFDSGGSSGALWVSRDKELAAQMQQAQQTYDAALQTLCGVKGARESWHYARQQMLD